jgi:PAS domain S-box-containing protein
LKARVIVPDVATESIWREEYRGLALKNAIRAGWSQPILAKENEVLGTFAVYSAESRVPTPDDLALMEAAARIALIAIQRQRSQETLRNALEQIQKSESNLRQVIDAIPALAWCMLPDGSNEFLNKGWHEYTGLSPEQSRGWGWQAAFHPEDLPPLMEKWQKMLASGESGEIEARLRRHDGAYRWFLIRAQAFRDESSNILRWYGTSTDIDDRKRAEEALHRSEFYLAEGQRLGHSGSWSFKPDGTCDYWSRELYEILGFDPKNGIPTIPDYLTRVHPEDRAVVEATIQRMIAAGEGCDLKKRIIRPDGLQRVIRCVGIPVKEKGVVTRFVGTLMDITEQEELTQELLRREGYLAEAQMLSNTGSFGWKPDTGELIWSAETYRIFEYDRALTPTIELAGQRVHPEDRPDFQLVVERASGGATDFEHAYRLRMPDGRVKHVHALAHATKDARANREFVGAVSDITERKHAKEAEDQLQAAMAERMRRATFRAELAVALATKDTLRGMLHRCAETIVRHLDAAFARIWTLKRGGAELELEASVGMYTRLDGRFSRIPIGELKIGLIAQQGKARLTNDVQNDPHISDHNWARAERIQSFAGYPLVVEERVVGVVGIFSRQALTESTVELLASIADAIAQGIERKRSDGALQDARAELERVSRVTTMGELAASIAHEINQPLAGVVTSANAGLNWLAANPPNLAKTRETLERILRDGTRGGEVLARIRALLKRSPPATNLVGMNQTVRDVLALTAGELRQHSIELSLELASPLPAVRGDYIQLQQVLLNLIKNAIEAMAGTAHGQRTLRIQSRPGELDGKPGVVVEVSDTGVGFDSAETTRLFEAFHTTKPQGMGMGLWISRSIIENHQGRLTASANDGPGATFVIILPRPSQEQE